MLRDVDYEYGSLSEIKFNLDDAHDSSNAQNLFSRCPQLTQFTFSPDQRPNWDTWSAISALPVAQELTSLEVRCAEVSTDGYIWLSKLPKLQCLKLYFGQHYGQLPQPSEPPKDHSVAFPHAFSSLRNLYISVGEELHHIIPVWRTIAAHVTHITIETWNRICTLDMFNQLFSSLVKNCPKVSFLHLHEYVPMSIEDNAPHLPVSHLSTLQRLPLRALRIDRPLALDDGCGAMQSVGALFPELEELWLEKTPIKMDDLLQATLYFPHVRRLRLCLHILKPTSETLSTILGDTSQYFDGGCPPDSKLALELHTGVGVNNARNPYNETDWDLAAK
ncbi:hypothetical protein FRC11_010333 [Ceratobasidium sp. 423]|nr:hypothetical protein FRC11_010333 [Ceratobasidium sp. 423]